MKDQKGSAEEALSELTLPTFEQMLDTTILNRIGQLCAIQQNRNGRNWTVHMALTNRQFRHHVTLLTLNEVVDMCRRNNMSVSTPSAQVLGFMAHVNHSLARTGTDKVLELAALTVGVRKDRAGHDHIAFVKAK